MKLKYMAAAGLLAFVLASTGCGGSAGSSGGSSSASSAASSSESSAISSSSDASSDSSASVSEPAVSGVSSGSEALSASSVSTGVTAAENTISASSASSGTADTDQDSEFTAILNEILTDVQAGTAGSTLKSTIVSADVLDFTMTTSLSESDLSAQTAQFLEGLSEEDHNNFSEEIVLVGETIHTLKEGNDAQSMLDEAGVTDSSYPWNDTAYSKADAILRGAGI